MWFWIALIVLQIHQTSDTCKKIYILPWPFSDQFFIPQPQQRQQQCLWKNPPYCVSLLLFAWHATSHGDLFCFFCVWEYDCLEREDHGVFLHFHLQMMFEDELADHTTNYNDMGRCYVVFATKEHAVLWIPCKWHMAWKSKYFACWWLLLTMRTGWYILVFAMVSMLWKNKWIFHR